jgi:hypothetical protein
LLMLIIIAIALGGLMIYIYKKKTTLHHSKP